MIWDVQFYFRAITTSLVQIGTDTQMIGLILHHHSLVHLKNHAFTKLIKFWILIVLCGILR